jgi:hypothetical protein
VPATAGTAIHSSQAQLVAKKTGIDTPNPAIRLSDCWVTAVTTDGGSNSPDSTDWSSA